MVKSVDFLGLQPKLHVFGQQRLKSNFGGIMSILAAALSLAVAFYFTVSTFRRETINTVFGQVYDRKPVLNFSSLPMMFSLVEVGTGQIVGGEENERYFDVTAEILEGIFEIKDGKKTSRGQITPLPMIKCNISQFEKNPEYFKDIVAGEKYWCFDNSNRTVYGLYGGAHNYGIINIYLRTCTNTTLKNDCYPDDVIQKKLANVLLSFLSIDNLIDHSNEKPFTTYLKAILYPVGVGLYKRMYTYYKPVNYTTDFGFVFTDLYQENSFQFANMDVSVDIKPRNPLGYFSQVTVAGFQSNDYYTRSYFKIQNLLANIGGIIKAIMIIVEMIQFAFLENYQYSILINHIFFGNKNEPKAKYNNCIFTYFLG
jgi:hypothetical protein